VPGRRQVITTVLGTLVAGSFFNQLQQFIDDPSRWGWVWAPFPASR
jgi:hypothetical protein